MHKNILTVVGITILFLGVGIQPAFATVQPEDIDVEYFDVTTEFIGLGEEHTVQLTQQQLDELDTLFESIREQLNNSDTKEETVQIYNKAIVELDSFGLLGDCSIKQVQELVTGRFQNPRINRFFDRLNDKIPVDNNTNIFCLIAGKSNQTWIVNIWTLGLIFIIGGLYSILFPDQGFQLFGLMMTLLAIWGFINVINPLCIGHSIFYYPNANGMVTTYGLNGKINWEGNLTGKGGLGYGAFGFKGLKIQIITNPYSYYIGFATHVKIEDS